jgi:uncharacterized membrane protein
MREAGLDRVPGADRARFLTLALLALLAVASLLAAHFGERTPTTFWLLVLFLLGPLALPLPGLVARRRRTYAWATFCVTPHFIYALTEIVANPAIRALAAVILVISLGLVVALVAYLRLTRGEAR